MELRLLRYFLMVAREGNITKAAQALHITQPTLSRQLNQLEDEIGSPLFQRNARTLELSDTGLLLRDRASEIIELMDKMELELQEEDTINGSVFLGLPETSASQAVLAMLAPFHNRYPQASFDITTGTADMMKERLDKGLIDVALLMEPINIEKYDFIRLPQKERWGVLMRCDDPLANQVSIQASDLMDKPLLVTKRKVFHNEISNWLGMDFEKLPIVASFDLSANATIMVKQGLGYATVVEGAFLGELTNEVCFRPFVPEMTASSVLAWKKHQVCSPTTYKLLAHIRMLLEHENI